MKQNMKQKMKLTLKQKEKITEEWKLQHGAASFDIKEGNVILHDGGLFSIETKVKYLSRTRFKPITEGRWKGGAELVNIKGPKVRHEFHDAYILFEDVDGMISYFKSMKRMLNKLGYRTGFNEKRKR